jgi:tRNA nucleotidyltransferase/poly(A) polymerase
VNLSAHLRAPFFKLIGEEAERLNVEAFAVGGFVRDIILNRPCGDIDFVASSKGIELAQAVAKRLGVKSVNVFKTYGTAHFRYQNFDLEFVAARKESYARDSRNPHVEPGSLEDDQRRRDFTINAMAIALSAEQFGELVDPFQGLQDIEHGVLRTPLDPDITYSDDPLRMMRAVRFSAQLNFTIEEHSLEAIEKNAERLSIVSMERVMTEFNKIVMTAKPSLGIDLLFRTKLLHQFFPEMVKLYGVDKRNGVAHKDNFYHTIQVLDNLCATTDKLWLRWAAIMHDIAKPATKRFEEGAGWTFHGHEDLGSRWVPKIFARLKLPLDHQMKYVQKLVLLHLRPIALTKETITDSAIRRLLFEAGDDIDDLMLLCRADITSKNENKVKRYLANYELVKQKLVELEERDRIRNFQPPVTGEEIMVVFDLSPCKEVGIIKNAIKDAILEGTISNDREEAYAFMLSEASKLGLQPKTHQ